MLMVSHGLHLWLATVLVGIPVHRHLSAVASHQCLWRVIQESRVLVAFVLHALHCAPTSNRRRSRSPAAQVFMRRG